MLLNTRSNNVSLKLSVHDIVESMYQDPNIMQQSIVNALTYVCAEVTEMLRNKVSLSDR